MLLITHMKARFQEMRNHFSGVQIDHAAELPRADVFTTLSKYLESCKSGDLASLTQSFFDVLSDPEIPDRVKLLSHLQSALAVGNGDFAGAATEMERGQEEITNRVSHSQWLGHEIEIMQNIGQAYAALAVNAQRAGNAKYEKYFEEEGIRALTPKNLEVPMQQTEAPSVQASNAAAAANPGKFCNGLKRVSKILGCTALIAGGLAGGLLAVNGGINFIEGYSGGLSHIFTANLCANMQDLAWATILAAGFGGGGAMSHSGNSKRNHGNHTRQRRPPTTPTQEQSQAPGI